MKPQLTTAHPKRYSPALRRVGVSLRADAFLKAQASHLSLPFSAPLHSRRDFPKVCMALCDAKTRSATANSQSPGGPASIEEPGNPAERGESPSLAFQFA